MVTESFDFAVPLDNILSNAEKLLPLFAMPKVKLHFKIEQASNILGYNTAVTISSITIKNFRVVYNSIHATQEVKDKVMKNPVIRIKTRGVNIQGSNLASGVSSNITLQYSTSLRSINSAFLYFAPTKSATNPNGVFESICLLDNNGTYSLEIGGKSFPNQALQASNSNANIFATLRSALTCLGIPFSTVFDRSNQLAILPTQYAHGAGNGANSSVQSPACFYVGIPLEALRSSQGWTGIANHNNYILLQMVANVATQVTTNVYLILFHDEILEFDPQTRRVLTQYK